MDETQEPTDEDLYAISTWSYAAALDQWHQQELAALIAERRFACWQAGFGYALPEGRPQ